MRNTGSKIGVIGGDAMDRNYKPETATIASDYLESKARYVPDEFDGDRQFATTLARGLDILHTFTPRDSQLGNAELAARTGMTKATISRFTYTLTRLGYLRVNRMNNKFHLGSAVLSLGYPLLASLAVRQIARPSMKELADHIRGSVSLGMRDRLNVVYLETSRSSTPLGLPADIGLSYPIVRTAMAAPFSRRCRANGARRYSMRSPSRRPMNGTPLENAWRRASTIF